MKREFLMLAQNYDSKKHGVGGWFVSEKLDGMRAFWDGGVTRGMPANDVPWANVEKDSRYVTAPYSTGLWTRYGKTIQAPDWWLDQLPDFQLDGELHMGRKNFQSLVSVVKTMSGSDWSSVQFMIFDVPPTGVIFSNGEINNTNFKKKITDVEAWYCQKANRVIPSFIEFESSYKFLCKNIQDIQVASILTQDRLPFHTRMAAEEINERLHSITEAGGEGLMLRNPSSMWRAERSHSLLKVKRLHDAEGVVVGYTWGKETDKGSKLLGKMGSLKLRLSNGRTFDLSGFTDEERVMMLRYADEPAIEEGSLHPGEEVDVHRFTNPNFPLGCNVTFTYRELTDTGVPKEARYWRKR